MKRFTVVTVALVLLGTCLHITPASAVRPRPPDANNPVRDYKYPSARYYNGIKVFLSPAWHYLPDNPAATSADKLGCPAFGSFYSEERNMRAAAEATAVTTSTAVAADLAERGYWVRVGNGDPDTNPRLANEFGAAIYIAFHSNGTTDDGRACRGERGGTETFNRSGNAASSFLAERIKNELMHQSPGLGDKRIPQDCSRSCFAELRNSRAPRTVYLEAGFHDFRADANWLLQYRDWAWRVAFAIDLELGYP